MTSFGAKEIRKGKHFSLFNDSSKLNRQTGAPLGGWGVGGGCLWRPYFPRTLILARILEIGLVN